MEVTVRSQRSQRICKHMDTTHSKRLLQVSNSKTAAVMSLMYFTVVQLPQEENKMFWGHGLLQYVECIVSVLLHVGFRRQ